MSKQNTKLLQFSQGTVDCIGLESKLQQNRPLNIKLGIDPTAPHIHLGHFVVIKKLAQFLQAGHHVHLVIGDFTAKIGDPTGKDKTRPILSEKQINENIESFLAQTAHVLDHQKINIHRNSDWLQMQSLSLLELLRHATVAQLLERDDFAKRMQEHKPLSMLEMVYPLLQGFDSVALKADVEIGGTDQLFNLMMGRSMQEKHGMQPQAVLTVPILTGTDGKKKMSKTFDNHISFTHSPEEVFGRTMSLPDANMQEWFDLLFHTKTPTNLSPRDQKRLLARKVVETIHSGKSAQAEENFDRIHTKKVLPKDIPEVRIEKEGEIHMPEIISELFGVSRSQARRLLKEGAIKLNGDKFFQIDCHKKEIQSKVIQKGRTFVKIL